jgi:hypothetical protein
MAEFFRHKSAGDVNVHANPVKKDNRKEEELLKNALKG